MKVFKKIIKAILIVCLTLMIIIATAIIILSSTIMDEAYMYRKLRANDYYSSIYKELKQNFENYIGPSGLDESILDDICTIEDIQNDTEIILGNIYEGTGKKVDTSAIKERLKKRIEQSLTDTKVTDNTKDNINQFIEQISDEYINTISHTEYEDTIYNAYSRSKKIIKLAKLGYGICIATIIVLLILINLKRLRKALKNLGIAFTSSGLFMVFGYNILNYNIKVEHLRVLNDSISIVLQSIVKDLFGKINYAGICLTVAGIALIIFGNALRKEKR